ncbi:MAG: N-acetylglucosamine-6-phosphate deacetylase [Xenococcaceae cyanobacterium]
MKIVNARLIDKQGLYRIDINDCGSIEQIIEQKSGEENNLDRSTIDVNGDWISLGGIDLQINGGLGLAFPDLEEKDLPVLEKVCEFLWQQGVDGFLATIVTTSVEKIQRSLSVIAKFMLEYSSFDNREEQAAKILGVHLEGPFLNSQKRGAHPEKYLLPLTIENVKKVWGKYSSIVKVITLAPELNPTGEVISYLKSLGIVISLGHSLATEQQAKKAFQLGASMVTHAFNAMPSLHHREPGLLGEAIVNKYVYCGLIADGQHVSPTMMKILINASDSKTIFLVSDALAPIGLSDGIYPWDSRQIEVINGTARLPDGTLAGTTLPLLVGVENLVNWSICEIEKAIAMATESPRKAIGLPGLSLGQPAHLLRWHWYEEKSQLTWQRLMQSN